MTNSSGNGTSSNSAELCNVTELCHDSYIYILFLSASVSAFLIGLPSNCWVLWVLARGPREALFSEIFTFNLAVLEVAYCLQFPLRLTDSLVWKSRFQRYFDFLSGLIIFGRQLFQGCICVERYVAVIHPIAFLRYKPLRYRLACVGVAWVITLLGCSGSALLSLVTLFYVLMGFMLVLLTVKSFCCLAVLRVLRHPGPGEGQPGGGAAQLSKQRAFRIIVVNLVQTLAAYLPTMAIIPLYGLISEAKFYSVYGVSYSISVFCAFVQPVHFLLRTGKLQWIMGC